MCLCGFLHPIQMQTGSGAEQTSQVKDKSVNRAEGGV